MSGGGDLNPDPLAFVQAQMVSLQCLVTQMANKGNRSVRMEVPRELVGTMCFRSGCPQPHESS